MKLKSFLLIASLALLTASCNKDKDADSNNSNSVQPTSQADISNTYGFGVLAKVRGIWNGPVTSTTPLGNYAQWIVDFRPISANQISAKNELDTLNDIHMSFFVALYNNQYRIAFRNGGAFNGAQRVSYFLADSVSESSNQSYYRFSEIIKGKSRAYTEVIIKADSLYIKSYTNKYNTLPNATPHMVWRAKLQDTLSCQTAINTHSFPKKTLTKDFSSTFSGQAEAVYYTLASDPYPETAQPYLGQAIINYSYASGFTPVAGKKVELIITTQPLFSGMTFNSVNLKTISRYVNLVSSDTQFTFNYMHPGTYYLYALYDNDNNGLFNSGDWVSTTNTSFSLPSQGSVTASTQINFIIP